MELYEKLDNAISDALDNLNPNSPKYCDDVKAARDLYEVKLQEQKVQNDYHIRAEELANETDRIENERKKPKVDLTQVTVTGLTSLSMFLLMILEMRYQKEGYIGIDIREIMRHMINRVK